MIHIDPQHVPFMLSLLPFFTAGIVLPPTAQDFSRGVLTQGDAACLAAGVPIVIGCYYAILRSVRAKKMQGKDKLLGRALNSWLWSPPATFAVGIVTGFALCN